MSQSTRILYDLIDKRLDALSGSHPYLESSGDLPVLRQMMAEIRSLHALELDAVKLVREVEDAPHVPAVLRAKRGAKK